MLALVKNGVLSRVLPCATCYSSHWDCPTVAAQQVWTYSSQMRIIMIFILNLICYATSTQCMYADQSLSHLERGVATPDCVLYGMYDVMQPFLEDTHLLHMFFLPWWWAVMLPTVGVVLLMLLIGIFGVYPSQYMCLLI